MAADIFRWGLVVLAAVIPISIAATNIVLLALFSVWLLGAAWTFKHWPPRLTSVEACFLLLIGVSVLSAVLGMRPLKSLREIHKDFYFLTAVFLAAVVDNPKLLRRMVYTFIGATLFTAVLGIAQFSLGIDQTDTRHGQFIHLPTPFSAWPRWILDELSMVIGRSPGTRSHPLTYAECLLFGLGFTLVFALRGPGKRPWIWIAASWVIGLALLTSQSRGPWLAAAALAIVAFGAQRSLSALTKIILVILPVSVLFALPQLRQRAVSIVDKKHMSNAERLHMWKAGYLIWKRDPLLGVGAGNVKKASPEFQNDAERREGPWGHLHNTYVNLLAERGALGLLAFLIFLGAIARKLWSQMRAAEAAGDRRNLAFAALLGLVGFLISALTETVYNDTEVLMVLFFVIGLSFAAKANSDAPR